MKVIFVTYIWKNVISCCINIYVCLTFRKLAPLDRWEHGGDGKKMMEQHIQSVWLPHHHLLLLQCAGMRSYVRGGYGCMYEESDCETV